MVQTFDRGTQEHNAFYDSFISRYADHEFGFVSPEIQRKVRESPVLFAGSGSVGGNMAMAWVEAGGEHITICDPDEVGIENLAGQRFPYRSIGVNKALARAKILNDINPYCDVVYNSEGITVENVESLVNGCEVVVDGIDIGALDMIYALHSEAARQKKPVIVGYDLAGTAMLVVYRYDLSDRKPLDGELSDNDIKRFEEVKRRYTDGNITKGTFLDFVYEAFAGPIPVMKVPIEYLRSMVEKPESVDITLQDPITPKVLGSLFVETVRRILNGEAVNGCIYLDIPTAIRPKNPNLLRRLSLMLRALQVLKKRKARISNL